jgi:hypothetical protein
LCEDTREPWELFQVSPRALNLVSFSGFLCLLGHALPESEDIPAVEVGHAPKSTKNFSFHNPSMIQMKSLRSRANG